MRRNHLARSLMGSLVVSLSLLILSAPASAIIIQDEPLTDVPSAWVGWIDAGTDGVGRESAVLIGPDHIATAEHVGDRQSVILNGRIFYADVANMVTGNGLDIYKIYRDAALTQEANLGSWAELYTGASEAGQTFVMGGFGHKKGDAIAGGYSYGDAGELLFGANIINYWTTDAYGVRVLVADFDQPALAIESEAIPADKDSGGGWFINDGGTWKLIGVISGVDDRTQANFGDNMSAVRVSDYHEWIRANAPIPEPATLTLLSFGAAALLRRRRR